LQNGKEINPFRLGDEKNASPQNQLRHPRRVLVGVTRRRRKKLDKMKLPEKERAAYNVYLNHMMSIASRNHTIEIDAKEIIKKAKEQAKKEAQEESDIHYIIEMHKEGLTISQIAKISKKTEKEVAQIIDNHINK
jgi:Helix-turn-helix domain of resolvase